MEEWELLAKKLKMLFFKKHAYLGAKRFEIHTQQCDLPVTGWLPQQDCVFSCSGGQKSKLKVSAGWVSPECPLCDLLCPHLALH